MISKTISKRGLYRYRLLGHYINIHVGKGLDVLGSRNINLSSGITLGNNVLLDAKSYGNGKILIGINSEVHDYSRLMCYGGEISIGENCTVNPFCVLYGHGGLKIGNNTHIATHCVIIPANHKFDQTDKLISEQGETRNGITIGDDVWIGANCVILDGVTIGNGSVIGAGSVVTKNIPPLSVTAGVPAQVIRTR